MPDAEPPYGTQSDYWLQFQLPWDTSTLSESERCSVADWCHHVTKTLGDPHYQLMFDTALRLKVHTNSDDQAGSCVIPTPETVFNQIRESLLAIGMPNEIPQFMPTESREDYLHGSQMEFTRLQAWLSETWKTSQFVQAAVHWITHCAPGKLQTIAVCADHSREISLGEVRVTLSVSAEPRGTLEIANKKKGIHTRIDFELRLDLELSRIPGLPATARLHCVTGGAVLTWR